MNLRKNIKLGKISLINFINLTDKQKKIVRNLRNNANVRKWMYSGHIISEREHRGFIRGLGRDTANFYWLAANDAAEYIGVVYLNRVDFKNRSGYLGIYANLNRGFSGAGRLLIDSLKKVAFETGGLHTLKLEVIDGNERALNFYAKSGFSREGRLKEFVFKNGKWRDVVIMGMINGGGRA